MSAKQAITPLDETSVAELAGELFDQGNSCTLSVLRATSGTTNQDLLQATAGFSCGIGKSGCLCGAITGGVMALGVQGRGKRSAELMSRFKESFKTTCCRGLSGSYRWMSEEHQANCRKITVTTAELVEELLLKQPTLEV